MSIDLTQYWPFAPVVTTKLFTNPLTGVIAMAQQTRPIAGPDGQPAITMTDFDANLAFIDRWYLRVDPALGVVEYRDDYAAGPMIYIKPAQWGRASQEIGEKLSFQMQLDPTASVGVPDDDRQYGWLTTWVEDIVPTLITPYGLFSNVARIDWYQSWCSSADCSTRDDSVGSYYFAPGVGIVRMVWSAPTPGTAELAAYTYTPA